MINEEIKNKIKKLIMDYLNNEFDISYNSIEEFDKDNPENKPYDLAYTTLDGSDNYEHEIQVSFDLNTLTLITKIDETIIESIDYTNNIPELLDDLKHCDFSDYIRINKSDDELNDLLNFHII